MSKLHPLGLAFEDIECFTEDQLIRSSRTFSKVAWARVAWLREPYGSFTQFLGKWVAQDCKGAGTPWQHNCLYRAKIDGVYLEFKVADLQECSEALKQPAN